MEAKELKEVSADGEVVQSNAFRSPVVKVIFRDFSNDEIVETDLIDNVEMGASGEKTDFITYKAPKVVNKYSHRKVIAERCKGQDLKSILIRVDKTGDISLLNQKEPVYGDASKIPQTLGDALDKGVESAKFLDGMTAAEKEKFLAISKSPEAFDKYVKSIVEKQLSYMQEQKTPAQSEPEKGEQK